MGRGGPRGKGYGLGEGRGEKRLKKSEHSVRSKWLQPAIRYHGDPGRGRREESGGLVHSPLLFLANFYSDEQIHLGGKKETYRGHIGTLACPREDVQKVPEGTGWSCSVQRGTSACSWCSSVVSTLLSPPRRGLHLCVTSHDPSGAEQAPLQDACLPAPPRSVA